MRRGRRTARRQRAIFVLTGLVVTALLAGAGGGVGIHAAGISAPSDKAPITLDIMDDDALLLITKTEGRDVVHVLGRAQIRHKERTAEMDELIYDEENSFAVMDGNVHLVDAGADGLTLSADHLELDLNTEATFAQGNVRFVHKDSEGAADVLRHGEFASLQDAIAAALHGRPSATVARVEQVLADFLPDDKVLLLEGNVDLLDGERRFRSEFVVLNTRDDALVSVGRSAATLPGPDPDDQNPEE